MISKRNFKKRNAGNSVGEIEKMNEMWFNKFKRSLLALKKLKLAITI